MIHQIVSVEEETLPLSQAVNLFLEPEENQMLLSMEEIISTLNNSTESYATKTAGY